jgi:hypothetical protein
VRIPNGLIGNVYSAVSARRTAFDTMMWQVPALGLTAQAFLLTIAYGSDSSRLARCASGFLALVVATVAVQTMRKHQANELTDSKLLEAIEAGQGITVNGVHPHAKPSVRAGALGNREFESKPTVSLRSFALWVWSLRLFAIAALLAVALTVFAPGELKGSQAARESPLEVKIAP